MKNDSDLDTLIETFFDEYYYYFSSFATLRGIHRYDYKLSTYDRANLKNLENLINEVIQALKLTEEKNKRERSFDIKTFRKIAENTLDFINSGIYGSAQFFVYDAFIGIVSVALTQSKPMSVRSRNFTERLSTLNSINDYVRTYVNEITEIERKAVMKEIDYLEAFINQFASYLLTKSDTDKKENLKIEKTNALEALNELRRIVKSIKTGTEIKTKGYIDFNNLDNNFVDLKRLLEDNLKTLSENLIRKAREIKISSSFQETLRENLYKTEQFDESTALSLISSVENTVKKYLPVVEITFDKRVFLDESDFPDLLSNIMGYAISSGEFDNKKNIFLIIKKEDNPFKLKYKTISDIFFGTPFINFYRQGSKSKKKYFLNNILYLGYPMYLRRTYFDDIKFQLDKPFELIYYYCEYKTALKSYIQNEIYFRNWDSISVENFINEDKILIDKDKFKEEFVYDFGRSFLAMQGLNAINDLRKEKRLKTSEFNLKLLQNMHYPFWIIRQILR